MLAKNFFGNKVFIGSEIRVVIAERMVEIRETKEKNPRRMRNPLVVYSSVGSENSI